MTRSERAPAARRAGRGDRRVNSWLTGAAVALHVFALLLLPLWLLPRDGAWGWLLVPLVLVTTPFWSLIHEAIHGTLVSRRSHNDRSGRVLSVLFGAPFALLKAGHLLHHRYSRTQRERSEVYDPAKTSWVKVAPGYYLRLIGGLYLLEVAAIALALLPAAALRRLGHRLDTPDTVAGLLLQRIAQPKVLRQFRTDSAMIVASYAGAFLAYGRYWWMLLVALAGRAFVVSVSDNAYHYGTRLEATLEAMNLRLPRSLENFALSFNLHDVHHRHPGLRWYELRDAFLAEGGHYHLGWFHAAGRQVRGPIRLTRAPVAGRR
jgi:fatty acid desaturase